MVATVMAQSQLFLLLKKVRENFRLMRCSWSWEGFIHQWIYQVSVKQLKPAAMLSSAAEWRYWLSTEKGLGFLLLSKFFRGVLILFRVFHESEMLTLCLFFLTLKKKKCWKKNTHHLLPRDVVFLLFISQSSPSEFQLFTKLCSIPSKTPHYSVKLELSHEFN